MPAKPQSDKEGSDDFQDKHKGGYGRLSPLVPMGFFLGASIGLETSLPYPRKATVCHSAA
jgi:hypothetical protein